MTPPTSNHTGHHPRWRSTLLVMFIAQFLSGVGFSFVLPFLPFYFRELGVATNNDLLIWSGRSSLVFGLTMAVTAPIWGIVADRYGRKPMVLRSMIAGSIILGLMGTVTRPWHLVALRVLQGATTGTVTAGVALVSSVTPASNRGFSLGLMHTGVMLGASLGPFFGGYLAEIYGYRPLCGMAAAALFVGSLLVLMGAVEGFTPPESKRPRHIETLQGIVSTSGFPLLLAIYFLIYILNTMVTNVLPLYIEELSVTSARNGILWGVFGWLAGIFNGPAALTGLFIGVTGTLTGISASILGRVGDRLGHLHILVLSLVAAGLILIPQAFAGNIWVLFIERCLLGLCVGGAVPAVNSLVSRSIPRDKVGSAYGLTSSVTTLGLGLGPYIGSVMATVMGLRIPFAIIGVLALILSMSVYAVGRKTFPETVPEKIGD